MLLEIFNWFMVRRQHSRMTSLRRNIFWLIGEIPNKIGKLQSSASVCMDTFNYIFNSDSHKYTTLKIVNSTPSEKFKLYTIVFTSGQI